MPGLVPIASIGYALGRDTVDVQWAPPGQPEMSEIPMGRLFYPAGLREKRAAEIQAAEEKRRELAAKTAVTDVDSTTLLHGLLVTEYPRHRTQDSKDTRVRAAGEIGGSDR